MGSILKQVAYKAGSKCTYRPRIAVRLTVLKAYLTMTYAKRKTFLQSGGTRNYVTHCLTDCSHFSENKAKEFQKHLLPIASAAKYRLLLASVS